MNRFATIEDAYSFRKVKYYTVQLEDDEQSLFLQFINEHTQTHRDEFDIIRKWLTKIGNEIGAKPPYFRPERQAHALPPPAKYLSVDCDLRWYCMRLTEQTVILFSGGLKTADTAQECDNVRPHFQLANKLAELIDQAILEKDILIDPKSGRLLFDPAFKLEL